ncbi:hypothetical protein EDD11_008170 [Mortierella claussenii]|nr:hypothetical protein EDD11_008170 [Mortierella claussenii]
MDSVHSSKQTRFISWLTENKAVFPKLDFCEDGDGCGSVYCSEDIASDEVFASIPFSPLVLTDALARKQLPSSVESLDGRTVLLLFVIQQRLLNEQSFFHPYLDMIPERIHNALEFDDQDLEHLKGTNAFLTVKELKAKLACKYEEVLQVVGEDLKPEDGYTWERYLWAETVIASRAFPAVLFGGGIEGEIVLIPLADSLNHKSRHKVTWIKTPQGLEISSSSIAQGQQVFNNYGPKGNMDDLVTIKTNFSRDPDQERKSDILKYVGVTEQTIHYLRHDGIPDLLLVTMRVMAMNSAEVDHCLSLMEKVERKQEDDTCGTMKQSITAVLTQELQFAGLRNEFSMLNLMDMLIHAKLQGITEWDQRLKEPQNQAQEFAQVYRQAIIFLCCKKVPLALDV